MFQPLPTFAPAVDDFEFSDDELKNEENETRKEETDDDYRTPLKPSNLLESAPNLPNKRDRTSLDKNKESKKIRAHSSGPL